MSDFLQVDESNFESEVLQSKIPVLVDFGATWCMPCVRQIPVLEKLALAKSGLKIVKIDIDDSPGIASKFGIRSVPSLLLFNNGQKIDMKVGLSSLSDLEKFVTDKIG